MRKLKISNSLFWNRPRILTEFDRFVDSVVFFDNTFLKFRFPQARFHFYFVYPSCLKVEKLITLFEFY